MEHAATTDLMPQSLGHQIIAVAVDDEDDRHKCLEAIAGNSIFATVRLEHTFFNAMHLFDDTYHGCERALKSAQIWALHAVLVKCPAVPGTGGLDYFAICASGPLGDGLSPVGAHGSAFTAASR